MTVKALGPRSSTPKNVKQGIRTLPRIPKIEIDEPQRGRKGRLLPQAPATTRPVEIVKLSPRISEQHRRSFDNSRISPKPFQEPGRGARFTRALPRVPQPFHSLSHLPSETTKSFKDNLNISNRETNKYAIPTASKQPRQLPKLPANGRREQKFYLYDVYRGEAEVFMKKGEYEKALESLSAALKLVPDNVTILVSRSKCHRLLGKNRRAHKDADSALNIEPLCPEAIFQKAEILYVDRKFEMALSYYSKGLNLQPDARGFQQGVEKTQCALSHSNSAGRFRKLSTSGDTPTSRFIKRKNRKPSLLGVEEAIPEGSSGYSGRGSTKNNSRMSNSVMGEEETSKPEVDENVVTERRMKEILGRMYNDKKYLEKLIEQTGEIPKGSVDLNTMAENGLNYLYDRVLYWVRQGRIIPPEAPGSRPSASTITGNSPLSPRSTISQDNRLKQIQLELNSTKAADPKAPGSWFRYLDRKKASEATNRKLRQNKQLRLVLEGQKMDIAENKPFSSIRLEKRKENALKRDKKKRSNHNRSREKETSMTNSESDSGLNISFSTYRVPSDIEQPENNDESLHHQTIQEEQPSPCKLLAPHRNPRVLKYVKRHRGPQDAIRRESIMSYVAKAMEDIEFEYVERNYSECANKANACLNAVMGYNEEDVPNIMSVVSKLHSYVGNAAIENKDYITAMEHHQKDLLIGEECNDEEATSRALGNLGRIFVFQNRHQKALELFSRKVSMCTTRMETAWLYHEIGNCFLVLGQYEYAKEAARRSIDAAEEAMEWSYQLQSCVLMGVAEVKLRQYHVAFNTFERAMDQARMQGDKKAEDAIREALNDVNDRIVEEMKNRSRSQQEYGRSRAETRSRSRSRAEWSDYSSIFIPEDDGDVSLCETGYDTDNLQLDLDNLRSDFETPMYSSMAPMTSKRLSEQVPLELKKSLPSLNRTMSRQTDYIMRSNTAMG